jgi:diguanylate cyclase (GGDEF)-like protein
MPQTQTPHSRNAARSAPPRARDRVFNSLSTRIIFFVFLSTFLSALVVSWISIHAIHTQLQQDFDRRFPALLEDRVHAFEALIEVLEAQVDHASRDRRIADALAKSPTRRPDLDALLADELAAMPDFSGLVLFDRNGVPVGQAGDVDSDTRQEAVVAIVDAAGADAPGHLDFVTYASRAGEPGGLLLRAIGEDDAPLGWLGARHDFSRFARLLRPESHEGSALLALAAPDGRILAHGGGEMRAAISPARLAKISDGRVHEYTSESQEHVLGAALALPYGHWTLLVEAPFSVAFEPVLAVVSRIFISDLVIILVFSFLAYRITAAIMRPIRALSEGARRISRGDFDQSIPDSPSGDEIGLMIRAFNDMQGQLRRYSCEFEDDQKRLTEQNEELHRANEVLAQLSITDGLTKLHNHRYFQDHLTREIKRVSRTGEPLSMILMDLDDFKRLNDFYGHAAGDELLVGVANILIDSVRESDLLARYGGEEFVILATGTSWEGAVKMAEKIRMSIETSRHIVDDSMRPIRVTISAGVATYEGDRRAFFQAADRALYDAKAQGKNCVVAASVGRDPDPA